MTPLTMLRNLERATNEHDLDALVDCFAADYLNETPAHPARGFRGRDQVRANWRQIFAAVPDLRARVVDSTGDGSTVWSEWEMSGTRRDGVGHHMRGVIVFQVADGRATSARFYLEPVDSTDSDVDAAVRAAVGSAVGAAVGTTP
jgi:ketosteroid isomerase-like protein